MKIQCARTTAITIVGLLLVASLETHAGDKCCAKKPASRATSPDAANSGNALAALRALPSVTLVDQDGKSVEFPKSVFSERLVVVNFVFTRCTTVCPPMGAAFGRLQAELLLHPDVKAQLISFSLDPAYDTPDRLREWSGRFGREPGWSLYTGAKPSIDSVLKSLEAFSADRSEHSALYLLGNLEAGQWKRIDGLASPREVIRALVALQRPSEAAALREGR